MASNEGTPLIRRVVIARPRQRYNHSTLRRFCTIALAASLIVILIVFLVPFSWLPGNHAQVEQFQRYLPWFSSLPHRTWPQSPGLAYKDLQSILLKTPKEEKAREWSKYYTSGPHLAGRNLSQAVWTKERWQEVGIQDTRIVAYDAYLNYPAGHRLALLKEIKNTEEDLGSRTKLETLGDARYEVEYECRLEEDVLEGDGTTGLQDRIPTFHGYSASGNVTAQFVFANFGTYWDYGDLVKRNISLEGKIVIVKYGRNFRGVKVKRAQELGAVGVVMYSDPQTDGECTEANGYKPYPDGPARNPSSVQRGSVQFISILTIFKSASQ